MKLVIDIDDKTYRTIKDGLFLIKGGRGSGRIIEYNSLKAIYDGEPLPKGHWKERRNRVTGHIETVCSVCGAEEGYPYNDYCGNCGAEMDEPMESEDKE